MLRNHQQKTIKMEISKNKLSRTETFLISVEKDLFENTKVGMAKNNLTRTERRALTNWKIDSLFYKESDTIARLQGKSNSFVIVDKNTDCLKVQQQTGLNHVPTDTHIKNVKEWTDEWKNRGEITKSWHDYMINNEAQPGKNSTFYKIHKEGKPIRLLTTGCNLAKAKSI